ncbi:hypothetical protein GF323_02710 [Candidatus Woesearchaeota archaeon]|nr:hypothetical protein [Candidatus Woesearchaeota archaeon]
MESMLITVALILAVSFVFSEIFYALRYPRVIGQIIAGMVLGLPFFSDLFLINVYDFYYLAEFGIIFLLLLTGLEINLEKFRKSERDSFIIAIFSISAPFIMGFLLMKTAGYDNLSAFIVGACLSLTAEGTTLKILMDMRALNTKIGTIIVGAGIFDDMIGILFLTVVSFLAGGKLDQLYAFPFEIMLFIGVVYFTYKLFPMSLRKIEKERSTVSTFSFIVLFGIIIALISKLLYISPIIGAFIAGIIIHLSEHRRGEYRQTVKELRIVTFSLIIPFFFIYIGLQLQKALPLMMQNLALAFMILIVATIGKIFGALLATPLTDLTLPQTHLIGWGLNSRGLIELVVATFAFENRLISSNIFGSIVATAVITTLIFPFIMKSIVKNNRKILNEQPKINP